MHIERARDIDGGPLSIRMAGVDELQGVMAARGLRREDHDARGWAVACRKVAEGLAKGRYYAVGGGSGDVLGVLSVETKRGPDGVTARGDARFSKGNEALTCPAVEALTGRLFEMGCVRVEMVTRFAKPAQQRAMRDIGFTEDEVNGPLRTWVASAEAFAPRASPGPA